MTVTKCAELVSEIMSDSGISSELLKLDDTLVKNSEQVSPIVYGEVRSKRNPNGKTILFYNHYDVQPAEPIELWHDDPFSGKIDGNLIYGRGASDDKGELITRIKAVEYLLKETGDVPCNVKFLVEGEEEIGSAHLEQYLTKYREKFSTDATIWEFGYVDEHERPIISLGMKGLLCVELHAKCANVDLHSSLAALVENPAWRLVHAAHAAEPDPALDAELPGVRQRVDDRPQLRSAAVHHCDRVHLPCYGEGTHRVSAQDRLAGRSAHRHCQSTRLSGGERGTGASYRSGSASGQRVADRPGPLQVDQR